ncbi:MAG: TadE/TadG family type IV pilus assembly protein [Actinomycetota bacterium]
MLSGADDGQATVEFALILPLLVICLGLVVQVLVVVSAQVDLENDARLAARMASMSAEPEVAARSSLDRADASGPTRLDVDVADRTVTVTVSRSIDLIVPILERLLPPIELRSALTMALEPPIHIDAG